MTTTAQPSRPTIEPTETSRPFWDAVRQHRLDIQRCESCRQHVFYPRTTCSHCGSFALAWVTAAGTGTVYTYTVARRPTHPALHAPSVIAIVELDEGPRLATNIIDCAEADVSIGMRVEVTFEDHQHGALPMFRPAR